MRHNNFSILRHMTVKLHQVHPNRFCVLKSAKSVLSTFGRPTSMRRQDTEWLVWSLEEKASVKLMPALQTSAKAQEDTVGKTAPAAAGCDQQENNCPEGLSLVKFTPRHFLILKY